MWFEYYRALGHICYAHPLLWWYSTLFYAFMLFGHLRDDVDLGVKGGITLLIMLQLCVSLVLGVLSAIYSKDNHYERRNYISVSDLNLNLNEVEPCNNG